MHGDNHQCWFKRCDASNTKNSLIALNAESSMSCAKTTQLKYFFFFPLVKRFPSCRASIIHNIMNSKIFSHRWPKLQIRCKPCRFMRNVPLAGPQKVWHALSVRYVFDKKEVWSKRIQSRACMCVKTSDADTVMVHSHFTMWVLKWVLLHMCMYKDSECVSVFLWLFLLHNCHSVFKCE